jgi:mycothiol synthase
MMCPMDLPPGLQMRPLTMDDAIPVHDVGEALIDDEGIVGAWLRPSFDLASQSVGVLDRRALIAYGEVFKAR